MIKKLLVIIPAIVLIAIGTYFIPITSIYVQYWVDDFCTAGLLNKIGFWGVQVFSWNGWTGRYSATFFTSFFEFLGSWVVRILPIFLLGLLTISLRKFYRINKILPLLFIFLTLVNAPNIIQTLYWQTGSLNYLAPFILLNIFLGLVVFPPKKLNLFLPAILLFIAGGFSEAYALAQLALLFFVLIGVKVINFSGKDERLKIILAGITGAVLSLGLMALSPGNASRATTITHTGSLWIVITSTLLSTKWYLLRMLSVKPFVYSLFFLFTAILLLVKRVKLSLRDSLLLGALSAVAAVIITTIVISLGFYTMGIIPPERALFVAIYMILICFAVFAFAVISLIHKKILAKSEFGKSIITNLNSFTWVIVILNLITSFFLIKSVISNWSDVYTNMKTYAVKWDRSEKELPALENIAPVGGLDSFTDNGGWVASCIAGYYKLSDVKITTSDGRIVR
jgi:hypothetical protein